MVLLEGCGGGDENVAGKGEGDAAAQGPTEQENALTLGRLEGGTYTNEYAGIGCELDESWTFYSAEELQSLPDEVVAAFEEGSDMAELLADQEQITDMMAENVDIQCTVNVLLQKVSLQERAAILALGEKKMIESFVEENTQLLTESYAQIGIEVQDIQPVTVTYLGEERTAVRTTGVMEGMPVYFVQVMDYTRGSSSVTITFTSFVEDNTQKVIDLFFALD